jgi:hypothetical protein
MNNALSVLRYIELGVAIAQGNKIVSETHCVVVKGKGVGFNEFFYL